MLEPESDNAQSGDDTAGRLTRLLTGFIGKARRALGRDARAPSYRERYLAFLADRCSKDSREAVGGRWEVLGPLQLEFLKSAGLRPANRLLDIGCGSLRGGLPLIRYLDKGNYSGVDISPDLLRAGQSFLRDEGLEWKQATLFCVENLRFAYLEGESFEFIWAQSVLTHMPLPEISELFEHVHRVMASGSQFFATYHDRYVRRGAPRPFNFFYQFETLRTLGAEHGLRVERFPRYDQPRKQQMLRIQRTRSPSDGLVI